MVKQDIGEIAFGQHVVQHSFQVVAQLLDGVRFARAYAQPMNAKAELAEHLFKQFLEKIALVLEVEIEGSPSYPGARDDIGDVGAMVALASENPLGVAQDLCAPGLFYHSALFTLIARHYRRLLPLSNHTGAVADSLSTALSGLDWRNAALLRAAKHLAVNSRARKGLARQCGSGGQTGQEAGGVATPSVTVWLWMPPDWAAMQVHPIVTPDHLPWPL